MAKGIHRVQDCRNSVCGGVDYSEVGLLMGTGGWIGGRGVWRMKGLLPAGGLKSGMGEFLLVVIQLPSGF